MKKELPTKFNVPEDYFSQLEKEILDNTMRTSSVKVIPLNRTHWIAAITGLVASILLILGVFIIRDKEQVTPADHLAAKEILFETYLDDNDQMEEFELESEPLYAELWQ